MIGVDVVGEVTTLTAADPASCDRVALAELVSTAQRVRGWLDSYEARIAMRATELSAVGAGDSAAMTLADHGRRSGRAAKASAARGAVCAELPDLLVALASGEVSGGHVDAVARLAGRLDDGGRARLRALEAVIVASARSSMVDSFEREMRDLERHLRHDDGINELEQQRRRRNVKRWVDKVTGMCHTHLELDPEADAKIASVFDAAVAAECSKRDDGRTFEQLQADVMVDLITGARTTDPRVPEVSVLIDHDTLRHDVHAATVSETADGQYLPPDVIRRMGCDAEITPIVLGGDGVPIDVGRARRLATREQRHALRAMYATCGHPHCRVRFGACRIHHVDWWDHLGPTDLDNLLPLCNEHHHQVHEGGWTLTLKADRTITLRRPDGSLAYEGITTDRQPRRPSESEIPEHLQRAARPNRRQTPPDRPPERAASP